MKANSFDDLFELIGLLARRRYQAAEQHFARLALNHTEARLLTLLSKEGGAATQDELSRQLHVDRSNSGRALKYLEEQGHITRSHEASDKRTNQVKITPRGRKIVAQIVKLRREMAQTFFGDLRKDEAEEIVVRLRKACAV